MPYCRWDDENWRSLIYAIRRDNCVLMLGAGVSLEEYDNERIPCTEILASKLAKGIKNKAEQWKISTDTSNLAQIAQYYLMDKGRNSLESFAEEFYLERKNKSCDIYKNLAELPFSSIITTAHDQMFYNALKEQGKEPVRKHFNFCGENPLSVPTGTPEKPLLFQLYGAVEEPESLILTEDDFLNFLVKTSTFPANITKILTDKNKNLLFLGFGFQHWYSRVLLHFLKVNQKEDKSFALEQTAPSNDELDDEFKRTIIFFKKSNYKIQFFKDKLLKFTELLKEKFTPVGSPEPECTAPKPVVFICHASEDKEKAADIYSKLDEEGFAPWLDREKLRGGDQWKLLIEKTIEKECDYFLVLQSKTLINKSQGFVIREINAALDKQKEFRKGNRFIIPLKIEECELLEELEFLQTIDLSEDKEYSGLIKDIKDNWLKRSKSRK